MPSVRSRTHGPMRRTAQMQGRKLPIVVRMSKRWRQHAWSASLERQFFFLTGLATAAESHELVGALRARGPRSW